HVSRMEIADCEAVRDALLFHGDRLDAKWHSVPASAIAETVAAAASAVAIERVARLYLASRVADVETIELELTRTTGDFDELAGEHGAWRWDGESRFTAGTLGA